MRPSGATRWLAREGAARSVRLVACVAAWLLVTAVLVPGVRAASPAPGTTERVSLADLSQPLAEGNGPSLETSVSADGRSVAFSSSASNLVDAVDGNGQSDVFVRDRVTGVTTLVSVALPGTTVPPGPAPRPEAAGGTSTEPSISADGRFIAFTSSAADLVDAEQQHTSGVSTDVFVRDLVEGTTRLVSFSDTAGERAAVGGARPAISPDGRWVAFSSPARGLGTMEDTCPVRLGCLPTWDVHVWDAQTDEIGLISAPVDGSADSARDQPPDISAGGRFVAFESLAENLIPGDTNGERDVFVGDRGIGFDTVDRVPVVTTRVSVSKTGAELVGPSGQPSISDDARRVSFVSSADADGTDGNGFPDVYLRDRDPDGNSAFDGVASETGSTTRVSTSASGGDADGLSLSPAISGDGGWVAWASVATNQVEGTGEICTQIIQFPGGDGNTEAPAGSIPGRAIISRPCFDVFAQEIETGATEVVSLSTTGARGDGDSIDPSVSFTGQVIGYHSDATNLVPGDTNAVDDAFVRDRPGLLVVAPGAGAFGDIPLGGSATLTFTATNLGVGPLVVSPADLVGIDPDQFVIAADGCAGQVLGHGDTCTVEVAFTPSAPGERSADLVVSSDVGGDPRRVPLSGRGTEAAIEISPDPGEFGSLPSGSSTGVTFTATSVGSAPLNISDVAVAVTSPHAADFVEGDDLCSGRTLAPQDTCTVTVAFSPGGPGARTASLVFTDDAASSPQAIPLGGIGAAEAPRQGAIIVTPDPGDFGSVPSGASRTLRFTAISAGDAPLRILGIAVEPGTTGSFTLVESSVSCPTVAMAKGSFCTVAVAFAPGAAGLFDGELVVDHDAPGSPTRVPLGGSAPEPPSPQPEPLAPPGGPAQGPSVILDPTLGPPGSVVQVIGKGFRPDAEVSLRWDPGIGLATAETDALGNFETYMLILPGDQLGPRLLVADDGLVSASAGELVVPQTTQARQFVTRG